MEPGRTSASQTDRRPVGDPAAGGTDTDGEGVQAGGSPDLLVGLVAGCYVAALLGPLAVAALARVVPAGPGTLYLTLLAVLLLVTVVVARPLRYRQGFAVALGRRRSRWLPALLPLALLAGGWGCGGSPGSLPIG